MAQLSTPIASEPESLAAVNSVSTTPPLMPSLVMHGGNDPFPFGPTHDSIITPPFEDTENIILQDFHSDLPSLDFLLSPVTTENPTTGSTLVDETTSMADLTPKLGQLPYSQINNERQNIRINTATTNVRPPTASSLPETPLSRQEDTVKSSMHLHHRDQDCMSSILQLVSDLHVPQEQCSSKLSSPPQYLQATPDESRDLDTVLFSNRDAIRSINTILDCHCATADRSVGMACYLAAAKIVDWYGAAIGITSTDVSQEDNLNSFRNTPISTHNVENNISKPNINHNANQSRVSLSRSPLPQRRLSSHITAQPIFMGRYVLDADVLQSVRAKVVLSEVREHFQPLLSRLPKYHVFNSSKISCTSGPELCGPNGDLHSSASSRDYDGPLCCALRNQLRRILKAAVGISKMV
ncbi:MAG: hypothetical protein M1820_004804 [Bogoriella megaspora]|nr:MAG: hypothetical protein M1820_004804 [Bogoriella megaspora]